MSNIVDFHINFVIFIVLTFALIIYRKKHIKLLKLIIRPEWLGAVIIMTIWSIYILKFSTNNLLKDPDEIKKFKTATVHGIIAFIIALFSYIDLTIPTFWFIWLIIYYIHP
jgi:hypothetical protein